MNMTTNYKEVNLDRNGRGEDRSYRNPLTKAFQYEYALYLTVAGLFGSVRCRSMCADRLKLYFTELGEKKDNLLSEMEQLVAKDVTGYITFPMMNVCAAEVKIIPEKDGTHSFIFTDGIYGFKLHLDMPEKGRPKHITVEDLRSKRRDDKARKPQVDCSGNSRSI